MACISDDRYKCDGRSEKFSLKEGGGDNSGKCDDAKAKQSGRWFGFLIFSGCILKNYLNGNCFFLFLFV